MVTEKYRRVMCMYDIPFKSIPDMLRQNSVKYANKLALKFKKQGRFVTLSYGEFYNRALMATRGLIKFGVKPGDRVAILSENRVGWVIADMGILCRGAVTVPIYATSTPEQIEYVLNHSGAEVVFVSNRVQYAKLRQIYRNVKHLRQIVSFERFLGDQELPVCTFYQMSEIDEPISADERKHIEADIDGIHVEDLLTLIYTSGTTGVPKGVCLTHANILFDAWYGRKKVGDVLSENEVMLSFLPLSHVLERTVGYYMTIMQGYLMAFAESIEKVPENMNEVGPTVMVSVPRLFEKIYSRILENVHQMSLVKRKLFHWALDIAKEYVQAKHVRNDCSALLSFKYGLADRMVFGKLRERFGSRMKFFVSGGAPLDKTVNEFFWGIGIPILEGYGLTETSPAVTMNSFEQMRFGSVGTLLEHTEVRLDSDGEILLRGPQVMEGYYKDEQATRETIEDGWFRTGDIGHIEDGYLFITDRKKELIITAGGKNIAPQPLENELKLDAFVSSAFVYGDRKPYLVALLVPNLERIIEYAKERHIDYYDLDDLVRHEPIEEMMRQRVARINSRLAQYESIKKFVLLPRDFSIEGGELTPTLKLRRKVIYEKYKDRIEGMYSDGSN